MLQSQDSQQKGNTFPQSLPVARLGPSMLLHSLCLAEGAQVSTLRDTQLAVCSLYTLPTLARESLLMGNLSFLPQFLGVLAPRGMGARWVFLPPPWASGPTVVAPKRW